MVVHITLEYDIHVKFFVYIIYFFNFMSMAFTGKPLINAVAPRQRSSSQNAYRMLYGQAIDTQKAMQQGAGNPDRPLVPKDWQLIARQPDGTESSIAENVVCFDVSPDGRIVYSDGRVVYSVDRAGRKTELAKGDTNSTGDFVHKVAILD